MNYLLYAIIPASIITLVFDGGNIGLGFIITLALLAAFGAIGENIKGGKL